MNSTHRVEVVPVTLEKHPNADALSIVRVFDGYTVCVRTQDWLCRTVGAYVPPDSVVPNTPEFLFLEGRNRIKVRKLRGIVSMGLLIPAPEGSQIGDDVAEQLGITHYDPPEKFSRGGENEKSPQMKRQRVYRSSRETFLEDKEHLQNEGYIVSDPVYESEDGSVLIVTLTESAARQEITGQYPKYDLEAFRKYGKVVFEEGEPVWITEKLHGTSARYVCVDGKIYCGSHFSWKRQDSENLWWKVLGLYPQLEEYLRTNPNTAVYGEVFGQVQDLKYGTAPGEVRLAVFDILRGGEWVDAQEARWIGIENKLPWVPVIAPGRPFKFEELLEMSEGNSLIEGSSHIREGIVVKPMKERWNGKCGRVCLKVVSNTYLEKA